MVTVAQVREQKNYREPSVSGSRKGLNKKMQRCKNCGHTKSMHTKLFGCLYVKKTISYKCECKQFIVKENRYGKSN